MTELDYYKAFLDWLGQKGKVTESDIAEFGEHFEMLKRRREATDFVQKNFKGMF